MAMRLIFMTTVCCVLGACAFVPQKAEITPHVDYEGANVGRGHTVSVTVEDNRASTEIGHRGAAFGSAATISTDQDISALFRKAIFDGLRANGFIPVPPDQSIARQFVVEIRSISYSTSTGFWTGGVTTNAAVEAQVKAPSGLYEKLYRYDNEKRVVFVPSASHNNELLSDAVSDVLAQMFRDPSLLATLAPD